METSDWAEEMAEELGRITVKAPLDPTLKSGGETANPITWANVTEDLPYAVAIHGGQVDRLPITVQEFEEVRKRLNAMLMESLKSGQPARTKVRWSKFKGGAGLIACIDESTQNWYANATKSIVIDSKTFRAWRPNERGIHKHPAQFYLLESVGIHPTESLNALKVWNKWSGSFSLGPTRKFNPRTASKTDCPDTCDEDDDNDENLQQLVKNEMKPGWRVRFYADDELRSVIEKNNRRAYLLDKEIVVRFLKNQPATTNPAKRPAPGAAPAAKKSKTSDGAGGRSQAKSAPKGTEAARRALPAKKDASEKSKTSQKSGGRSSRTNSAPKDADETRRTSHVKGASEKNKSSIPPKADAEQASTSKGKSKKSSKKTRKSAATSEAEILLVERGSDGKLICPKIDDLVLLSSLARRDLKRRLLENGVQWPAEEMALALKEKEEAEKKSVGKHPNRQVTLRPAILGTGNEPSTSVRSTMAESKSTQQPNVDSTPTDSSGTERC